MHGAAHLAHEVFSIFRRRQKRLSGIYYASLLKVMRVHSRENPRITLKWDLVAEVCLNSSSSSLLFTHSRLTGSHSISQHPLLSPFISECITLLSSRIPPDFSSDCRGVHVNKLIRAKSQRAVATTEHSHNTHTYSDKVEISSWFFILRAFPLFLPLVSFPRA